VGKGVFGFVLQKGRRPFHGELQERKNGGTTATTSPSGGHVLFFKLAQAGKQTRLSLRWEFSHGQKKSRCPWGKKTDDLIKGRGKGDPPL